MEHTEVSENKVSGRIEWIDLAKGLTLLLVVIGHSVSQYEHGSIVRGVIYSFHMPLFFILSCTTFRCSENIKQFTAKTSQAAKRLLIPAVAVFLILIIESIIRSPSLFLSAEFWRGRLFTLVFSSGVITNFSSFTVQPIGMIWFFFALFAARTIFDYLHLNLNKEMLLIISMLTGIAGIVIGQMIWLPFSLDIALAIMPFMYFGHRFNDLNPEEHVVKKMIISLAIWICIIYITFPDWGNWTYMELAIRRYQMFPLCYIGAAAGTVFICELSVLLSRIRYVFRPLVYFGRNSLYFFCIHILDSIWIKWFYIEDHQFRTAGKRLLIDIIIFAAFMLVRYLVKKIFSSVRKKQTV